MVQTTMPDSTSSSIATENSNKGLEHTAPETIDALVEEVSNKIIFFITKNLVTPSFPSRLAKARKKETEHDIFEIF